MANWYYAANNIVSISLILIPEVQNHGKTNHSKDMIIGIIGISYMSRHRICDWIVCVIGVTTAIELHDLGLERRWICTLALAQLGALAVEDECGHRMYILRCSRFPALVHIYFQKYCLRIFQWQLFKHRGDSLTRSAPMQLNQRGCINRIIVIELVI